MGWTMGEVLQQTFRAFARSWVPLVVGYLVMFAIAMSPLFLWATVSVVPLLLHGEKAVLFGGDGALVGAFVGSGMLAVVGALLLFALFAPAMTRIALAAARGQRPRVAEVFDFRRAGTMVAAGLLSAFTVLAGLLMLVVPGVIVAVGLSFVSYFVVDSELGALDAMGASWTATRGHRLRLFGLMLLAAVTNVVMKTLASATLWLAPLGAAWSIVFAIVWTLLLATVYERIRPAAAADELASTI